MELYGKNVGLALTGSFCTYEKAFQTLEELKNAGANLYPILSDAAQRISSRFGTPKDYLDRVTAITDGPVLMAAKAHLRTGKPLVIAVSTNDGLGMNLKNIGLLFNSKSIYFVPFGQDNWVKKPNSLVARLDLLKPTLEHALEHKQYQPVLISYPEAPSRKES
ncbi:MAG: dipicolinate synthase subunit B [Acetatifactor sp.]|nr:dipicolinate synthase subunit B [Acetatifactor sp.]